MSRASGLEVVRPLITRRSWSRTFSIHIPGEKKFLILLQPPSSGLNGGVAEGCYRF
jgi:hypothetical protein